jgi:thiol:disulfide interchange protein DsbC
MNRFRIYCLGALTALACSGTASATEPAAKSSDPRAVIAKKFPGVKLEDIRPSPIGGVYEVLIGGDTGYVSADGRYLIAGDMFDVDSRTNLTEATRTATRTKLLAKLDEREMIVFSPEVVKHTVTVFTDVDCGYCRKLHSQIDELNALGVQVRYMAYPRSGPGSDDWRKMEAVWCSKDRKSAITQAKAGQDVKAENCGATPVAKHFALGGDMGVQGTPAIFTRTGDYIGGYLPPAQLVKEVEASEAKAAGAGGAGR